MNNKLDGLIDENIEFQIEYMRKYPHANNLAKLIFSPIERTASMSEGPSLFIPGQLIVAKVYDYNSILENLIPRCINDTIFIVQHVIAVFDKYDLYKIYNLSEIIQHVNELMLIYVDNRFDRIADAKIHHTNENKYQYT